STGNLIGYGIGDTTVAITLNALGPNMVPGPTKTITATIVPSGMGDYVIGDAAAATVYYFDTSPPPPGSTWQWIATGSSMQPSDNPANWLVGGMPAMTPPPNDGTASIIIGAGTAPIEFKPTLSVLSSISVPAGWGKMMQLDSGLEITGIMSSGSTI